MTLGGKLVRMFRRFGVTILVIALACIFLDVRIIAIITALGCLLLAWMAAGVGNASDRVAAAILLGYGATTIALVGFSFGFPWGKTILQWFLIVTIGLTIVAYSLPQSFWRLVGLRN